MLERIVFGVIEIIVIVTFVLAIKGYFDLPKVYWSNTSNTCVKIELSDGEIVGCENLKKYDHYEFVWVQ